MARPSLKIEKTETILQAYEHCVATYGVAGATLQKVAETADMARPLLRHYVGNQVDLLSQCLARYLARQQAELTWFATVHSLPTLLDGLFNSTPMADDAPNDVMIASAFSLAAPQYPEIKAAMQTWFEQIQAAIAETLKRLLPHVDSHEINVLTTGLVAIYFNYCAMQDIDNSNRFAEQSRQAAERLLTTLVASPA